MEKRREKQLEAYLVAAVKAGDRTRWDDLVKLRSGRLIAHATRLLSDRDAAQDIVQESWVDIMRGIRNLHDIDAFLPWALRIVARKVAKEIKRRQKGRAMADELEYEHVEFNGGSGDGELAADRETVRRAVADLPPKMRATIALFYLEDLSVADVATAMDLPVGTVKTRLMHARSHLLRALKGEKNEQVR